MTAKPDFHRRLVNLLVILCVGVFMAVFLQRIEHLSERTERLSVQQFLALVNSALTQQLLQAALSNRLADLNELAGTNPMKIFTELPSAYRGEYVQPDLQTVPTGSWYFDPESAWLVYRPRNRHFARAENELYFSVGFEYRDRDQNGRFDLTVDGVGNLRLVPVKNYAWLADNGA